jgi:phosphoribosylformimino-5-aminoimidazole carboxamide ribonucleotide (ProFAR) isomerase
MSEAEFELYPAVDIRDGRAVRLTQGRADAATEYDDPVDAAMRFAATGHALAARRRPRRRVHRRAAQPAPHRAHRRRDGLPRPGVGGSAHHRRRPAALDFGAARVVVGTMALTDPDFVPAALEVAGDRLAVGLDARGGTLRARGWTEDAGDLFEVLARLDGLGVARFIFTDIETDGMLSGPNLAMLTRVADATSAAVTASGGVASVADLVTLATLHPRVDGAIVGRALYSGDVDLAEALAAVAAVGS